MQTAHEEAMKEAMAMAEAGAMAACRAVWREAMHSAVEHYREQAAEDIHLVGRALSSSLTAVGNELLWAVARQALPAGATGATAARAPEAFDKMVSDREDARRVL